MASITQAVSHERGTDNVSADRAIGGDDALDLSRFACEESNEHLPFVASGLHAHRRRAQMFEAL